MDSNELLNDAMDGFELVGYAVLVIALSPALVPLWLVGRVARWIREGR
jgi:hypothetical protein